MVCSRRVTIREFPEFYAQDVGVAQEGAVVRVFEEKEVGGEADTAISFENAPSQGRFLNLMMMFLVAIAMLIFAVVVVVVVVVVLKAMIAVAMCFC